jgi:hypothetical protein
MRQRGIKYIVYWFDCETVCGYICVLEYVRVQVLGAELVSQIKWLEMTLSTLDIFEHKISESVHLNGGVN